MLKRAIAAIALWAGFGLAHATSVVPLYLDEIIDTASVAFEGVCLENRTGRDPQTGLLATFTTFEVGEVLKGSVGSTYTIKQIGGEDKAEGRHFKIFGVPTFAPGQGYIVFLAGVSPQGFSSPIGLSQGRFEIVQDASGAKVTNGRDFHEMSQRMSAPVLPDASRTKSTAPMQRMDLGQFKQLVRDRVAAAR